MPLNKESKLKVCIYLYIVTFGWRRAEIDISNTHIIRYTVFLGGLGSSIYTLNFA